MAHSRGAQRAAVRALAADAGRAAERERALRSGMARSSRQAVASGKILVLAGLAGILLVALWPRQRNPGDAPPAESGPGLFERAGTLFVAAVRWRSVASEVSTLFDPPPAPSSPAES